MYKICLITDMKNPLEGEELLLLKALKADSEFDVGVESWDDPAVDWSRFETLIIRSAWDYTKMVDKFVAWVERMASQGLRVLNPPEAIKWNSNKRYLLELQQSGVPLLPTVLVNAESVQFVEVPDSTTGWIVKPTVGASAQGVRKFDVNSKDRVVEYAEELANSGVDVLIQPFAEEISRGEVSFVFFGDQYSHACTKRPADGDFRVQPEYGGRDNYFDASGDQVQQARAVVDAVPFDLLYARVDMVEVGGRFVLMELELIEPYLFFGYNQAPQTFISALKKHL